MSFILPLLELRCKDTLGKGNTIIVDEGRLVGINDVGACIYRRLYVRIIVIVNINECPCIIQMFGNVGNMAVFLKE